MLSFTSQKTSNERPPIGVAVFALAAVVGLTGSYLLYLDWLDRAPLLPQLTAEAKAYLPNLALSGVKMGAEESFLEQTIIRIDGILTNHGTRPLLTVDIYCVFREPYGQEIGRELARIVGRRSNGLAPSAKQSFRLSFDNVAPTWNQARPDLYIVQVAFAD